VLHSLHEPGELSQCFKHWWQHQKDYSGIIVIINSLSLKFDS